MRWSRAALCGVVLVCGCAIDRTSMSMDSVSRSPWFGLQLKPKQKSPVYHRSIARSERHSDDAAQIQPALAEVPRDSQWPQWLALPSARAVYPLPRTDTASDERRLEPLDAAFEF